MAKTETRVKVVFTKAGEAYSATQAYRLHDYIVLDGVTLYDSEQHINLTSFWTWRS